MTDFMRQDSNNHIGLYKYRYDKESIAQLLNNPHNDTQGNALLNVEKHIITFKCISVANLKVSQFTM